MPELPEVETIKNSLIPICVNSRIEQVLVYEPRLRERIDENSFQKWLPGSTITQITRRSKYLLFQLNNEAVLVAHLGMSGRLGVFSSEQVREKHTHVVIRLHRDGIEQEMRYRDPRRFGLLQIVEPGKLSVYPRFIKLGVEPLKKEFNKEYLFDKTQNSRRPIKNLLMDAEIVVGVGNIYANEVLYICEINPLIAAGELSLVQIEAVVQTIKKVLRQAIEAGGTTLNDYRNGKGEPGFFQLQLLAYGRDGETCSRCGSTIVRAKSAGRSTFFCPACQK